MSTEIPIRDRVDSYRHAVDMLSELRETDVRLRDVMEAEAYRWLIAELVELNDKAAREGP